MYCLEVHKFIDAGFWAIYEKEDGECQLYVAPFGNIVLQVCNVINQLKKKEKVDYPEEYLNHFQEEIFNKGIDNIKDLLVFRKGVLERIQKKNEFSFEENNLFLEKNMMIPLRLLSEDIYEIHMENVKNEQILNQSELIDIFQRKERCISTQGREEVYLCADVGALFAEDLWEFISNPNCPPVLACKQCGDFFIPETGVGMGGIKYCNRCRGIYEKEIKVQNRKNDPAKHLIQKTQMLFRKYTAEDGGFFSSEKILKRFQDEYEMFRFEYKYFQYRLGLTRENDPQLDVEETKEKLMRNIKSCGYTDSLIKKWYGQSMDDVIRQLENRKIHTKDDFVNWLKKTHDYYLEEFNDKRTDPKKRRKKK